MDFEDTFASLCTQAYKLVYHQLQQSTISKPLKAYHFIRHIKLFDGNQCLMIFVEVHLSGQVSLINITTDLKSSHK